MMDGIETCHGEGGSCVAALDQGLQMVINKGRR